MVKHRPLPPIDELRKRLAYRSDGVLIWKRLSGGPKRAGFAAGCINSDSYIIVKLNQRIYKAHRIVWAIIKGEDPQEFEIDHINGDRSDNRIENLRKATSLQNHQNRKHVKGYYFCRLREKWVARILFKGKTYQLGRFNTEEQAREAYLRAKEKLHGEYMPTDMKHELGQIDGPTSQLDLFND